MNNGDLFTMLVLVMATFFGARCILDWMYARQARRDMNILAKGVVEVISRINALERTNQRVITELTVDESRLVAVPVKYLYEAFKQTYEVEKDMDATSSDVVRLEYADGHRLTISEVLELDDREGVSGAPDRRRRKTPSASKMRY